MHTIRITLMLAGLALCCSPARAQTPPPYPDETAEDPPETTARPHDSGSDAAADDGDDVEVDVASVPARAPKPAEPAKPGKAQKEAPEKPEKPTGPTLSETAIRLLSGFRFGSYGRMNFSWDLARGSQAKPLNLVAHGPRLEEPPYAEIDLGYRFEREDALSFSVQFTLAFLEDFFHYNGEFEAKMAVRNLYLQADHVFTEHLSLWAGSRMYRGDDAYLLDYWPLDNLNTLGGGAFLNLRDNTTKIALHVGVNRLREGGFQYQTIKVPSGTIGADEVVTLDRQRTVISLKATQEFPNVSDKIAFKIALYGEVHRLPEGTFQRGLDEENLPADTGWVAGLQIGLWKFAQNGHLNLWVRGAGGLAAYGELATPWDLSLDKKASSAKEFLVALSGNYESGLFGLQLAGYARYFVDADGQKADYNDGWEYVVAARPYLFLHRHFHQAFELSYQGKRPNGLNPRTQSHLVPGVFKASVIPTLSWDRGTYTRPHLRLVYTLTYQDAGARLMHAPRDPKYDVSLFHYLGVQVEWWFNSSYR